MRVLGFFPPNGVLFIIFSLFILSCEVKQEGQDLSHTGDLEPVSASEFNSLLPQDQYRVTNKLASTLYKGVPPGDFFDLERSEFDMTRKDNSNYLQRIKDQLNSPLPPDKREYYLRRVEENYNYDSPFREAQEIMTMLWEFPLSRDYYDLWMAYFLANTIMFTPGQEVEPVQYLDIKKVYSRLLRMISQDYPVREIVYQHMISQENWRRFRSPEDNTREMMEIFLRRFRDEEVPKAAKACQNWSLTGQDQGYQLVVDYNENTEPQSILDTTVTTCWDFYRAIADHPRLMPTVVAVIVDHLFSMSSEEEKQRIVDGVLAKNPRTFRDIFNILLFSRAYLLGAERPKKWEEAFLGTAKRIYYKPSENFFRFANRVGWGSGSTIKLYDMKQPPFIEKLGRTPVPPLDALSFAFYHKSLRENLMINRSSNTDDAGWQEELYNVQFTGDDFINYIFVTALGREATQEELDTFNQIFESKGFEDRHRWQKTRLILDYISRLPEFYMFRKVK